MSWKTIKAILRLDGTEFESGVKRAESSMDRLGRKASGAFKAQLAGAFSVAAIGAFVHKVIEAGDRIKDMADVFGISTDEVQKLDIAAKRNAKSFEDVGRAMDKMGSNREEAVATNEKLLHAFNRLGISAAQLRDINISNLELLKMIAKVAESGSDQQRADAMTIMGKGGAQILATLKEFRELGNVGLFRQEDLAAIEQLKDAMSLWQHNLLASAANVFGNTAKAFDTKTAVDEQSMLDKQEFERLRSKVKLKSAFLDPVGRAEQLGQLWEQAMSNERRRAADDALREAQQPGGSMFIGPMQPAGFDVNGPPKAVPLEQTDAARHKAFDIAFRSLDNLFSKIEPTQISRLAPDQLQQVGGFVGLSGAIDPSISVQTSQLKVLEEIANILDNIGKGNQGAGQLPNKAGDAAFEP